MITGLVVAGLLVILFVLPDHDNRDKKRR